MWPVLFQIGPFPVRSYAVAVAVAFVVSGWVRQREVRRLGYDQRHPGHVWVGVGGLMGAMLGAKLGLLLFEPPSDLAGVLWGVFDLDFTGKTVLGGIAGGYAGVEILKKIVGIRWSTGDAFALALPLGQAIGRVGCLLNGCCWGTEAEVPWAVHGHGAWRHPTVAYEALLLLVLAGVLWLARDRPRPQGHLFRSYLVGYALIRFSLDFWRADAQLWWGPLTAVQWVCLAAAVGFGAMLVRRG
jgi:phosphatidylglycerol:prolipoprotein diacylglycerol transferase